MKNPLSDLAAQALEWIRGQGGPSLAAELYLASMESRGLQIKEGALDVLQHSQARGVGLRLVQDGQSGFACAGQADLETIQGLFRDAVSQLEFVAPEPAKGFPQKSDCARDAKLEESLWDEALFQEPLEAMVPRLKEMEASVLGQDKRVASLIHLGYGESRGQVAIANTHGVMTSERSGSVSLGLSALARAGAEIQVGSASQSVRRKDQLDFTKAAREAAQRSTALLGSRKLPSARRAVIFDPWVAGEFLDLVAGLLSADSVQRGKSLLKGRLGRKVGEKLLHFVDDARRPFGLASCLFDDEGCPTRSKIMIDQGVVKEFFHDTMTANKEGLKSNASAGRPSYGGLPSPGPSNFYLAPGPMSREKLLSDTKDGILVLDIMGMHMADLVSGEFSVGVSGLAVQGGKLGHAVQGAMISGNILELLGRVDAVADDLTFYGGLGAPTFRIAHMTVA